jgi:hypothetical protein
LIHNNTHETVAQTGKTPERQTKNRQKQTKTDKNSGYATV